MVLGNLKSKIQLPGLLACLVAVVFVGLIVPPNWIDSKQLQNIAAWYWLLQIAEYHELDVNFYVALVLAVLGLAMLGVSVYRAIRLKRRVDVVWAFIAGVMYAALAWYLFVFYEAIPHFNTPDYCKAHSITAGIGGGAVCATPG